MHPLSINVSVTDDGCPYNSSFSVTYITVSPNVATLQPLLMEDSPIISLNQGVPSGGVLCAGVVKIASTLPLQVQVRTP